MIWTERINYLLDRLHDAEIMKEKSCGYASPISPDVLLMNLHSKSEIETILLYEITRKHFFELEAFEEEYGKELVGRVKLLQKLDDRAMDYQNDLSKVKADSIARKVRLQIIKLRHNKEYYYNGGRQDNTYTAEFFLDQKEIDYLKPVVFKAIFRTEREPVYDRIALTIYDTEKENVIIEKCTSMQNSVMRWTVSIDVISAIADMPINFAKLWCYRWDYPITNHTVGTHNDSFIFVNSSAKSTSGENARIQEMVFENGRAINGAPQEMSDYAYGLAKQVFGILKEEGMDLYEIDRAGELY